MKCPRVSGQHGILLKYVGGRLDENAAAAVSRHLQTCHACTETVREYSAVFDALSAWHPPCISTNCNRTLPPGTEPANSEPWYKRMSGSLHPDFVRVGLPMAAGVVLIAAGLIFDHWFDSASAPVPRLSVTEAEQAESTLDDIQLLRQFDNAVASSGSSQSM